jgi:hypothetical protein
VISKPQRVWYVAYGSNVNEQRFLRYLVGDSDHVGARDATPPRRSRWTTAALQLRFAGESQRWGGGVCFVDPDPSATAYVRAWDITAEQFEDVFAQENRRALGEPFDWPAAMQGTTASGASWYGQILPVDLPFVDDDQPALTFTWTTRFPLNTPASAYRDTISAGLADHPDLSPAETNAYLDASVA